MHHMGSQADIWMLSVFLMVVPSGFRLDRAKAGMNASERRQATKRFQTSFLLRTGLATAIMLLTASHARFLKYLLHFLSL